MVKSSSPACRSFSMSLICCFAPSIALSLMTCVRILVSPSWSNSSCAVSTGMNTRTSMSCPRVTPTRFDVCLGEERTEVRMEIAHRLEAFVGADDLHVAHAVLVLDGCAAHHHRRHRHQQPRSLFECMHVGERELLHAGRHVPHAGRLSLAGNDDEQIGANAHELFSDVILCALADRDQHDDRRDADDHTEHGEKRAHLVRCKCVECDAQVLEWIHAASPLTRSSTRSPSTSVSTRRACSATRTSCVTTTIVVPSALSSPNS